MFEILYEAKETDEQSTFGPFPTAGQAAEYLFLLLTDHPPTHIERPQVPAFNWIQIQPVE